MEPRISPPPRAAIYDYWRTQPNIFRIEFEAEGMECFACHEAEDPERPRGRLERAHIVARSAGGAFELDNFILLCPDCHREAPMTSDREILFYWVVNHARWGDRLVEEVELAIKKYKINPEDITEENLKGWQEMMRTTVMRFHPRSLRQEKLNLIAMMLSEYLRRVKWTPPVNPSRADERV